MLISYIVTFDRGLAINLPSVVSEIIMARESPTLLIKAVVPVNSTEIAVVPDRVASIPLVLINWEGGEREGGGKSHIKSLKP